MHSKRLPRGHADQTQLNANKSRTAETTPVPTTATNDVAEACLACRDKGLHTIKGTCKKYCLDMLVGKLLYAH